jgi:hypothetical protein
VALRLRMIGTGVKRARLRETFLNGHIGTRPIFPPNGTSRIGLAVAGHPGESARAPAPARVVAGPGRSRSPSERGNFDFPLAVIPELIYFFA